MTPRLLVPLTMVWAVRNVVYSGVLERLVEAGVVPVIVVPEPPPQELEEHFASLGVETAPLLKVGSRASRLDWFLGAALNFSNVRKVAPATLRHRRAWYERHYRGKTALRYRMASLASHLIGSYGLYKRLRRLWERRLLSSYHLEPILDQLESLDCTGVWFNNWGMGRESPYVAAADALDVPTVTSIMSFDNVLTKGARPHFDRYLVWSERTAEELLRADSGVTREIISVVGTPQFDFHLWPELVWDRVTTLGRLGLPPDSRYFLYGAGREYHSPGEVELVKEFARRISKDARFEEHRVVVRLHPLDPPERWVEASRGQSFMISKPFDPPVDADGWSWSSLDDQALLVNSLRYADACLSIASTIALDAAILETPAIGVRLDRTREVPAELYFDAFELDHYRPLVKSGGLWVARSWEELLWLLHRAVIAPGDGMREREAMVREICGVVDRYAGDRSVREVVAFLQSGV